MGPNILLSTLFSTAKERHWTKRGTRCPQITRWSLRGVNFLSAVRGSTKHAVGRKTYYWSAIRRRSDSQHNCKHRACSCLVHFFLWGNNIFTLDSNEHYFRSRNLALPQDLHCLRRSTCDLWTVHTGVWRVTWRHKNVYCWRHRDAL
jgi:hypothetical protein